MEAVYGAPPDLSLFADLIISHELTHLTDLPTWLDDPGIGRRSWSADEPRLLWLSELFANLGMHGYIADREPESLPVMETVFEVVGGTDPARWPMRRLQDMYDAIAAPDMDGTNYLWFEFRLQIIAKRLWEAAGGAGFQRLRDVLHGPVLPDAEIFEVLAELDKGVAGSLRRWTIGALFAAVAVSRLSKRRSCPRRTVVTAVRRITNKLTGENNATRESSRNHRAEA
jgi:hypothetical protein